MIDGLFLQAVEGLEDGPVIGGSEKVWRRLQGEKHTLSMDLVPAAQKTDASEVIRPETSHHEVVDHAAVLSGSFHARW